MGKATGFLEYERRDKKAQAPKERIRHFREFHEPLPEEEQKKQGARCMDCGVPFCQAGTMLAGMASGCPLNNLVPEWNDLVYRENWQAAYQRLKKTNNFPEFTSRVCPALCEKACTCNLNGEPVATRSNEYAIIERAYQEGYAAPKPPKRRTGNKVAVIGSGPSGLAAADQLNKRGHQVCVYEREDKAGGLLRYGIPNMKLEKQIIDRKIAVMEAEGVEFVYNCDVGKDEKATEILKKYDSVILACGAKNPRDIKVPGRDAKGIYFAVDFLASTTRAIWENASDGLEAKVTDLKEGSYISARGKRVMIIGGGDTGNDCCGTAIRHGAKSVLQVEMMPQPPMERAASNPWPEWPLVCKTDYGQEEAKAVYGSDPRIYQTTVKEFIKDSKGKVCKAVLVKLASELDKKTGRGRMAEIAGSEYEVQVDMVLIAAGFLGCEEYVTKAFGVERNQRTNVKTAQDGFATNVKGVYTAGDMHRGQSLVVWAIREGRDAARAVDYDLLGY